MHKKNAALVFSHARPGFLLTEFIIAFALLSLAVLMSAHAFFSTVCEYRRAKQRLDLLHAAQNSLELSRAGAASGSITSGGEVAKRMLPVVHGIILPNMPLLKQESIEIALPVKTKTGGLKVRGRVKE